MVTSTKESINIIIIKAYTAFPSNQPVVNLCNIIIWKNII